MTILQGFQSGQIDMNEVIRQVIFSFVINIQIVTLFQGHDDLIQQFVLFLPREYQCNASILIEQLNQGKQLQQQMAPQPVFEQPTYVDYNTATTRRKTRVTRQPRTQVSQVSQVPQVPTPVIPPTPTTRSRRRIPDDEMEVEQDTIPVSERRFFDRVLILASSFIID